MRRFAAACVLLAAFGVRAEPAVVALPELVPDAGTADAGSADAGPVDPCGHLEEQVAKRKAWLAARREEQFKRGGMPDPSRGVPNMTGVWCEAHPDDVECGRGNVALSLGSEELAYDPNATPEDFDAHVLLMKRELRECRRRQAR